MGKWKNTDLLNARTCFIALRFLLIFAGFARILHVHHH